MENKIFKVGEIVAKVTEKKYKEFKSYNEDQTALRKIVEIFIETATEKEKEYQNNINEWWEKIKIKHNLPTNKELNRVSYFGGNLILKISYITKEIFVGSSK